MPLTVSATMHTGLPLTARAASNAARTCAMSLPSVSSITWKPKAANLSAIGIAELTSSMVPSICRPLWSTITTRLSSAWLPANMAASHTWPSSTSPSPSRAKTR